jgi:hypothetical protein
MVKTAPYKQTTEQYAYAHLSQIIHKQQDHELIECHSALFWSWTILPKSPALSHRGKPMANKIRLRQIPSVQGAW